MNSTTEVESTINEGICRFCGLKKKCRILNAQYDYNGHKEVYSDMIYNCFGLVVTNLDSELQKRLVCANCVMRLRDAVSFRTLVFQCEEALLSRMHGGGYGTNTLSEIKQLTVSEQNASNQLETIKLEAALARKRLQVFSQGIQRRQQRPALDDDAPAIMYGPDAVLRKKLLARLERMKALEGKNKSERETISYAYKTPRRLRDSQTMHNTIDIVRNSYVCPFNNIIGTFHCYYCKKTFVDPEELRTHTAEHDTNHFAQHWPYKQKVKLDITRIDCKLCPERIYDINTLKKHLNLAHNKNLSLEIDGEFLQFKLKSDSLDCLECGEQYMFIDKLMDHMAVHFGAYVCDVCGNSFVQLSSLEAHMRCHKRGHSQFQCHICNKNLRSNRARFIHIAVVHEKKAMIKCFKCDKAFLSYDKRDRHLIDDHGDKRTYTCRICSKVFSMRKTYVSHNRTMHQRNFKHQCEYCSRCFKSPKALKKHYNSHMIAPVQPQLSNLEPMYTYTMHMPT